MREDYVAIVEIYNEDLLHSSWCLRWESPCLISVDSSFLPHFDGIGVDFVDVFCLGVSSFLLLGDTGDLLHRRLLILQSFQPRIIALLMKMNRCCWNRLR